MLFMLILKLIVVAVTSTRNEAVPVVSVEEVFFDCRLCICEQLWLIADPFFHSIYLRKTQCCWFFSSSGSEIFILMLSHVLALSSSSQHLKGTLLIDAFFVCCFELALRRRIKLIRKVCVICSVLERYFRLCKAKSLIYRIQVTFLC